MPRYTADVLRNIMKQADMVRGHDMNRAGVTEVLTRGLRKRFKAGLAGLMLALPLLVQAQTPQFMPADIPLDTGLIYKELQPEPEYAAITRSIVEQMRRNHYSTIRFDDSFSST